MSYKRKDIVLKNKTVFIFLSLYIVGLVFSLRFTGDTFDGENSIRSGIEMMNEGNWICSVIRLSMSFFSVSLVMWAVSVIVLSYKLISWTGALVSFYIGYSSGCSTGALLGTFSSGAVGYVLLCIIPAAIIRLVLWYIFYRFCSKEKTDKRKDKNKYSCLLYMLFAILFSDVFISAISVVLSDIFF